jgi:hypothetical protein
MIFDHKDKNMEDEIDSKRFREQLRSSRPGLTTAVFARICEEYSFKQIWERI